jgi:formylglycine-generating enzyme required for sulfatase activity
MAGEALDIFISYSHRDEGLKDELVNCHLNPLQREGKIRTWQDRDIEAGAEWAEEIRTNLENADIVLLLITRHFLASDYCYEIEMQRAVQRHCEGTARVIAIILKPCFWQESPFSKLQVLPKDGKPVTTWDNQDEAFVDVEKGIRRVIDSLNDQRRKAEVAKAQEAEELNRQQEAAARLEQERQERERQAAEQHRLEQAEAQRQEQERQEQERLDRERLAAEQRQREQAEAQRIEQERQQQEAKKQKDAEPSEQDQPLQQDPDTEDNIPHPTSTADEETVPPTDEPSNNIDKMKWWEIPLNRRSTLGWLAGGIGGLLFLVVSSTGGESPPDPEHPRNAPPPAPPGTGGDSDNPEKNDPPPNVKEPALKLQSFSFPVVTLNAQGKEISRVQKQNKYFVEDLGQGIGLDMVAIPGGSFMMGSPKGEGFAYEKPQHRVTVRPFYMSKFPITQAEWSTVAAMPKVQRELNPNPSNFKGVNRPVEQVSWDDAVEFCQRLSRRTKRQYRLPSEAQWEYACRAETTTPFHFGLTITTDLANYDGNYTYGSGPKGVYREETTDVGRFPPNAFGLYDMHGNVWEWCQDVWHDNYDGAPTDGSAWMQGGDQSLRLLRGGSWYNVPGSCRSALRYGVARGSWYDVVGLRVVCSSSWALS